MQFSDYKVGDWLKDIPTGDIYEITAENVNNSSDWFIIAKRFDGNLKQIYPNHFATTCSLYSFRDHFMKVPMARLLYSNEV